MKLDFSVYCTHPEEERNLKTFHKANLIEQVGIGVFASVFRCPKCQREIVIEIKEEVER